MLRLSVDQMKFEDGSDGHSQRQWPGVDIRGLISLQRQPGFPSFLRQLEALPEG